MAHPANRITNEIVGKPGWGGASVVERQDTSIKLAHPTQPARYFFVGGAEPLHISGTDTEINTAWVNADPIVDAPWQRKMELADYHAFFGNGNLDFDAGMPFRYVNPQTGDWLQWQPGANVQWTNDLNQLENIGQAKQGVTASIVDDRLDFAGAYGAGLDYAIELQTGRLRKELIINSLATLGSPPQFIIDGGNPVLMLSLLFERSAGVTIWVDGQLWAEGNGQGAAASSFDYIEFKDASNQTLWYLDKAYARDFGLGDEPNVAALTRIRRQGGTFFIEIRVPWVWLQNATYPVVIDPTVNPAVAAAADDVSESSGGNVEDSTNRRLNSSFPYAGFRIALSVAQDATVNDSYLSIYGDHPSLTDLDADWDMVAEDNCAAWSTGTTSDVSGRTLTGNAVDASITLSSSAYTDTATSATAALEALFARAGWSSGNYGGIVLAFKGTAGNAQYSSYNDSASEALKIFIDYTEGGAINLTVADWGVGVVYDAAVLTQVHSITVADWAVANVFEGPVALTQTHVISVDNWGVAINVEGPIDLAQTHVLSVDNWSAALPIEGPVALAQVHILAADNWTVATPFEGPVDLSQVHVLSVDGWAAATAIEGPITISVTTQLVCQDWNVATSVEGPVTLAQTHALAVDNWASATSVEGPVVLAQIHIISVDDWTVATPFEGPITLSTAIDLVVANWTTATSWGSPALTQTHNLTVDDWSAATTHEGPVALVQTHILSVADWSVATLFEGPITITVGGIQLVVADWSVATSWGSPTLTQVHNLIVANWAAATAWDGLLVLVQNSNLVTQDWSVTTTIEGPITLTVDVINLLVDDWAVALPIEGPVTLVQTHILAAADWAVALEIQGPIQITDRFVEEIQVSGYGKESVEASGYGQEDAEASGYGQEGVDVSGYVG